MGKKISSIIVGPIIFYTILTMVVFFAAIDIALFSSQLFEEGIGVFIFTLLWVAALIVLKFVHYLDYIIVTEEGIKRKKQFYSWNEIFITVGYSDPREHIRKTYFYQFYFGTEFLLNKDKLKDCKKKGLFVDINEKRLNLILQYYKKSICIAKEFPFNINRELLDRIKEHNNR